MLGFQGNGIFKKSDQFYSEISTPGYCNDCAFMQEDFTMSEEYTTLGWFFIYTLPKMWYLNLN